MHEVDGKAKWFDERGYFFTLFAAAVDKCFNEPSNKKLEVIWEWRSMSTYASGEAKLIKAVNTFGSAAVSESAFSIRYDRTAMVWKSPRVCKYVNLSTNGQKGKLQYQIIRY